jgi:membrane associated rhomboid family serine protease
MFPLGDDNEGRRSLPVITFGLIALNVVVFLVELNGGEAFIRQWAFIPRRFGADPAGDAHTVFSAMFMHGGWLHLGGNMLYLWIFGDNVEDAFGPLKFLVFYLVCGIAATFAQFAVTPNSNIPNVGASGAIAGVLGGYLLMYPHARVRVLMGNQIVAMPALVVLGLWIVLQVFSGVGSIAATAQTEDTGGVAYMAHVGGFVAGFLLTLLLRDRSGTR